MRTATEIYYAIALATVFVVLLIGMILIGIWRYYKRRQAHELAVVQFEQTLLQSRLEIQEQTLTSIAQEIHDNIGQVLTLAASTLRTINYENAAQVREKVEAGIDLISHSIQSFRDLAKSLNGGLIMRTGLVAALEAEVRRIEALGIMHSVFRVFGEPRVINENKSLIIFRIVQEALQNVIKHAGASVVEMQVHFTTSDLVLVVIDNGKGIAGSPAIHDGSGLRNMKDRAHVIGAQFEITPATPGGTKISLTIPGV